MMVGSGSKGVPWALVCSCIHLMSLWNNVKVDPFVMTAPPWAHWSSLICASYLLVKLIGRQLAGLPGESHWDLCHTDALERPERSVTFEFG